MWLQSDNYNNCDDNNENATPYSESNSKANSESNPKANSKSNSKTNSKSNSKANAKSNGNGNGNENRSDKSGTKQWCCDHDHYQRKPTLKLRFGHHWGFAARHNAQRCR